MMSPAHEKDSCNALARDAQSEGRDEGTARNSIIGRLRTGNPFNGAMTKLFWML